MCSRLDFAKEILRLSGKTAELTTVPSCSLDASETRPDYSVLDNFILRIIDVYDMPSWQDSLKEYLTGDASHLA